MVIIIPITKITIFKGQKMYLSKLRYKDTHINANTNANNIFKLNYSHIIYPETSLLLAMLPICFHQTEIQGEYKEIIITE